MDTTADAGLKQRHPPASAPAPTQQTPTQQTATAPTQQMPTQQTANGRPTPQRAHSNHPGGRVKHGRLMQVLRMFAFAVYFNGSIIAIFVTQALGLPLYYYSRDLFYAWMAMTKQHFGIVVTTMTYWWAPVKMRVSGDASVRGQLRKTPDGRIECDFPERIVLISNHQIYTDWIYLWWIAYTARMHGHLYIILKESIRYIPILGTGMMLYGFVFLSRKWATDKQRFQYRLKKLSTPHPAAISPDNPRGLNPMWLLIFPEGTNLSANGRAASAKWAAKQGIPDLRHALLPRSTGLSYCLQELRTSVDFLYDCTLAYEGVPAGQYGQDLFSLHGSYFQGRPPKSVNMHWRRFATADIPLTSEAEFSAWLVDRWREKDDLLQAYLEQGRFPADDGWIETDVRPVWAAEWMRVFAPVAAAGLLLNVVWKAGRVVLRVLGR